ncbi:putative enzyme related to lactoylglutathione lyase [Motilibacter peucedani]|uniref:Putative enzyme related to lactoylglutathione lyase n=1 Tax=Motilibacter peucedani TaxID=598650 RepID=A0A420XLB0_9ACTN|nr:VOC family protein [Motilibacter peucedani]RKS71295.1 putative enzyme related to lactoylglutathione lyase [Motilibacter peucedani]
MQAYARGELAVVIDCADLDRAAAFWTEVLGYRSSGYPGSAYRSLLAPESTGVEVLLQRVPEGKLAKSRVHLDLRTRDLDSECERVTRAGAVRTTEQPISEGGWVWHVFADPDGNEFCVLQPPTEHWSEVDS